MKPTALSYQIKKAAITDIDILTKTRVEVLRAANRLSPNVDMHEIKTQSYSYYKKALCNDTHIAYLAFDENRFIGRAASAFFRSCRPITIPPETKRIL